MWLVTYRPAFFLFVPLDLVDASFFSDFLADAVFILISGSSSEESSDVKTAEDISMQNLAHLYFQRLQFETGSNWLGKVCHICSIVDSMFISVVHTTFVLFCINVGAEDRAACVFTGLFVLAVLPHQELRERYEVVRAGAVLI